MKNTCQRCGVEFSDEILLGLCGNCNKELFEMLEKAEKLQKVRAVDFENVITKMRGDE